jgi:hypothetical protein
MRSRFRRLFGRLLIVILALNGFLGFIPAYTAVQAQDKADAVKENDRAIKERNRAIIVNADQPNVWTLEQAHYLLAQMHRRNLDLKAKSLEDLDPNEIAGLRFDVMRMLIEFGATFNQADLEANKLLTANQTFNSERRQKLLDDRTRLSDESVRLSGEIKDLEIEKADTEDADQKSRLDAKIAALTAHQTKVDKQIESIDDELKTLNAPTGTPTATTGGAEFNAEKLPKSLFDKAFEAAAAKQIDKFNDAPKINASLRLENFLQMQYEIIAKQLTLLRDEVGPGERLLFLELPQTVNVSHHEANDKWAQSWWKIVGYMVRCPKSEDSKTQGTTTQDSKAQASSVQDSQIPKQCPNTSQLQEAKTDTPRLKNQRPITTTQESMSILRGEGITVDRMKSGGDNKGAQGQTQQVKFYNKFINLDKKIDYEKINEDDSEFIEYLKENNDKIKMTDQQVRTVDLIPRQSSLNVNDMKLQVRAGAFNFMLSTLFGFGSRLNIQRQREQFSQFVQQELYSAAFGKGSREFGWTFTPMPGTDRLMSGVRTTYAVVVVPEEATSLIVESNGCYFPRSAYQPNNFDDTRDPDRWGTRRTSRGCGEKSKAFVVPIPSADVSGSNDFWVQGVSYQPVGKGDRIVVQVSGKNFSSQIGVLINGTPLIHSIGLAQPLIRDDSVAGRETTLELKDAEVQGRIERVDSNKIVFSFKMPDDFEGTPTITLIAPGKAIDINWLENINVNGKPARLTDPGNHCNKDEAEKCERVCNDKVTTNCFYIADDMFRGNPVRPFRIDGIEAFRLPNRKMAVLISGAGFKAGQKVYVNGVEAQDISIADTLLHVRSIDAPTDEKIQVAISLDDKTIKSSAIVNPAQLKIDKVTVVSYEAAKGKQPGVLVVKLDGNGFSRDLVASKPHKVRVDVTSSTEAFLTITNPDEAEVVTLSDPNTKLSVSTVVARKPPK